MLTKSFRHGFVLLLCMSSLTNGSAAEPTWTELFNGQSLDGWLMGPDRSWRVADGAIYLQREFDGQEHNRDYLWVPEVYDDFVLELEFKVAENTNSGIYLRTADRNNPVYTGIEVQVANSFGRDELSSTTTAGAIYDCLAPSANPLRAPGEWNKYVITCRGPQIHVVLNGTVVIDMDLDQWNTPHRNPNGSSNKFDVALKDFARRGSIGLQDHGRPVWYRNLRVKRLVLAPTGRP